MKAPEEIKLEVRTRFDELSKTYDQITFLRRISLRLVELANLKLGQKVLDIATGTGVVAFAAAQKVGFSGRVIGIDFSPEMLAKAKRKHKESNLPQLEFHEGDAEKLDFPDQTFDVVLCSLGLFFIPNMPGALQEWLRVLKPGGMVGFSSFGEGMHSPLVDLWNRRLEKHGLSPASVPVHRLRTPTECSDLLIQAGFREIKISEEPLGYFVKNPEERMKDIIIGLEGEPLKALTHGMQEQINNEHLKDLEQLMTPDGFYFKIPAVFSFARR